jgi:hypothetical protein
MAVESYPEEAYASATATPDENTSMLRDRRRHSFHAARKLSCDYQDADAVFIRVCTCIIGGKYLRVTVCLIKVLGRTLLVRTGTSNAMDRTIPEIPHGAGRRQSKTRLCYA